MAYVQFPSIVPQYFADSGDFLAEGVLYAYEAGTTIPTEFYADDTGTSLGVSITLNARGEFSSEVYLDDAISYKFVLKTKDGVQIWERDNVDPPVTANTNTFGWVAEKAGTYASTTSFTVAGNPVNDAGDAVWQAERRARIYRHTNNDYLYATVQSGSYSAALDKTTITLEGITDDTGAAATLSDEDLTVWAGVYVPGPTNQGGTSLPVDDTTALVRDPADNTKQLRVDVGAVATETTRTMTVSDADIEFVGASDGDAIVYDASAKKWRPGEAGDDLPVDDTTALVRDPADNTKQAGIDAEAVAAGQFRRIFMPNRDIDLAGYMPVVQSGDTITSHVGNIVSMGATSYSTVFDLAGVVELVGGAAFGVSVGFRLTIDGDVVFDETATAAADDSNGDAISLLAVPAGRSSTTSMKLEIYNARTATSRNGWRIFTR